MLELSPREHNIFILNPLALNHPHKTTCPTWCYLGTCTPWVTWRARFKLPDATTVRCRATVVRIQSGEWRLRSQCRADRRTVSTVDKFVCFRLSRDKCVTHAKVQCNLWWDTGHRDYWFKYWWVEFFVGLEKYGWKIWKCWLLFWFHAAGFNWNILTATFHATIFNLFVVFAVCFNLYIN